MDVWFTTLKLKKKVQNQSCFSRITTFKNLWSRCLVIATVSSKRDNMLHIFMHLFNSC